MPAESVHLSEEGGVLTLTLARVEQKNALDLAMYSALAEALERAAETPSVRVALLRADGDAFCAGNDLNDFMGNPPTGEDSPVFRFLMALSGFPKPLVVAVGGAAVGIGTTLLLHSDLVYASPRASFKMPFVPLGLVPEAGSSLLLPRIMGHAQAAELLLLGERFSVEDALRLGILTRVVPHDELEAVARERAGALARLPPQAVRQTKALMTRATRAGVREAMLAEGEIFVQRLSSPETAEAVMAFFQKRAPDFSQFE